MVHFSQRFFLFLLVLLCTSFVQETYASSPMMEYSVGIVVLTDLSREIDRADKLLKARTDISSIRRDILQKVYQHMQRRTNELIIKTQ